MKSIAQRFFTVLAIFSAMLPAADSLPVSDAQANETEKSRPNIVYILADDLGYGDVQSLNPARGKIPTPQIDSLAREGMMMTDVHSASSVCTPSRYGILTGRYAWRTRLQDGVLWGLSKPLIAADRLTVGELLRRNGYVTAGFGKWHLGLDWSGGTSDEVNIDTLKVDYADRIQNGPTTRGFDTFYGIPASLDMAPYVYINNDRLEAVPTIRQTGWSRNGLAAYGFNAVDVLPNLTRKVSDYINQHAYNKQTHAKPFFIYLALTSPHSPLLPTAEWQGKSHHGEYADFVMQTDWAVGEVLAALERARIADNTIVIFTSDNGCSAQASKADELEKIGHFPSAGFRGYKFDLWEGGHRVPFLVRWPGHVASASVSNRTACLTDLLATCAELVGNSLPDNAGEDSVSMLSAMLGRDQATRQPIIHHSMFGYFSIRDGRWKLLLARGSGGTTMPNEKQAEKLNYPAVQLYDLLNDPKEEKNLAAKQPDEVARLTLQLSHIVANGRTTKGKPQPNDVSVKIWKDIKTSAASFRPMTIESIGLK